MKVVVNVKRVLVGMGDVVWIPKFDSLYLVVSRNRYGVDGFVLVNINNPMKVVKKVPMSLEALTDLLDAKYPDYELYQVANNDIHFDVFTKKDTVACGDLVFIPKYDKWYLTASLEDGFVLLAFDGWKVVKKDPMSLADLTAKIKSLGGTIYDGDSALVEVVGKNQVAFVECDDDCANCTADCE